MKQIGAVHDMSGFGRCSLTVVLPVLAAMGVRACPVQTAYLSAHTGFPGSTFFDMTRQVAETLAHWKTLNVPLDGLYSGFLGAAEQIDLLEAYIDAFQKPGFMVFIDPVMGDNGKVYRTYTPHMCTRMRDLATKADVITPNITEAALLLGVGYDPQPRQEKVRQWLEELSLGGKRSVVLTGVKLGGDQLGAGCYDRGENRCSFAMAPAVPGHFSGTGDLFASIVLGHSLAGGTLADGVERAVNFVSMAAAATIQAGGNPMEGANFEGLLAALAPTAFECSG